jgi:hypothetical protein
MPDFNNLPKHQIDRLDGGLRASLTDDSPLVLLLGTASKGPGDAAFNARNTSRARATFGSDSELYQGLVEARRAYGDGANLWLFRIGTTPGILTISGSDGKNEIKIMPRDRVSTIGSTYKVSWNGADRMLWIYNANGSLVYSNAAANPVDVGEIEIRGTISLVSGSTDIGDASAGTLADSYFFDGVQSSGFGTFTAANTGPVADDMRGRYTALEDAYRLLDAFDCDIVVPLKTHADDPNVAFFISGTGGRDKTTWESRDNPQVWYSGTLGWFKSTAPTSTSADGAYTYLWADDVGISGTMGEDVTQNFWDGSDERIAAGFHEVSFAYQLANFCYQHTKNQSTCIGVIGMVGPISYYLGDIHKWVGDLPVKNAAGSITTNGYGLLGLPETVGCAGSRLNPLCHDKTGGRSVGYFATDSEFKDAAAKVDEGGNPIDIGAYLSIVGEWPLHVNAVGGVQGYSETAAHYYAGMIARLDQKDPPTNNLAPGLFVPYQAGKSRHDKLVQAKIVMLTQRDEGAVVVDAPTAATDGSDFRRLSTVRLVTLVEDRVRAIGQKYIGKVSNALTREAFNNDVEEGLQKLLNRGYLKAFRFDISATPIQDVLGQLYVKLVLVVPNELRQIFTTVSLSIE